MSFKKINLRDFRQNLTKLRDSGYAYTVLKKGKPYAYFVPTDYEVEIKKKGMTQEKFGDILEGLKKNRTEFKDEIKGKNYKEGYRELLEKKYLKDE